MCQLIQDVLCETHSNIKDAKSEKVQEVLQYYI